MKCSVTALVVIATLLGGQVVQGQAADPYKKFNEYRAAAKAGQPYPGAPLRGKVIGFANIVGTLPFCVAVENSIREQLRRAGLDLGKGWISVDNQGDPEIGLKNAQMMLKRRPDFFIEFQLYPEVNEKVARIFAGAKIPVLAIDVPMPGAPYMGVDNYKAALLAGHHLAKLIRQKWGGWDGVDLVAIETYAAAEARSRGVVDALVEEFGPVRSDSRLVQFECDCGAPEEEGAGMKKVLDAYPGARTFAMYAHNEPVTLGMIGALQAAGRWDPARKVAVSAGADETGHASIRDGTIDAAVAFFPERYGEYVVPAVCAILGGSPVPPFIYMDNEIITRENIDRWYPRKK